MTSRCVARGCRRASTSRVRVGLRIISEEIVRYWPGMAARLTGIALLCPSHEQAVAEGQVVRVKPLTVVVDGEFEEKA